MTLFWTKPKRAILDGICIKIGQQCHVSKETARETYIPYIRLILQKRRNHPLIGSFEFTPEEVNYLVNMGRY